MKKKLINKKQINKWKKKKTDFNSWSEIKYMCNDFRGTSVISGNGNKICK